MWYNPDPPMIPMSTIHFQKCSDDNHYNCVFDPRIFTFVAGHCGCVKGIGRATLALINRGKNDNMNGSCGVRVFV